MDIKKQIAGAKAEIASWPQWMQDAAVTASATFPKVPESLSKPDEDEWII